MLDAVLAIRAASYAISFAVSLLIFGYSFYGYAKIRDSLLAQEAVAFLLLALGAAFGVFSFWGYYFDAVGFLIIGILHAKTAQKLPFALLIMPEIFGAGIAIIFSLYAGVETLLFYSKKKMRGTLFSGIAFLIIAASMFIGTIPAFPSSVAYIAQAVGYVLLLPAVVT